MATVYIAFIYETGPEPLLVFRGPSRSEIIESSGLPQTTVNQAENFHQHRCICTVTAAGGSVLISASKEPNAATDLCRLPVLDGMTRDLYMQAGHRLSVIDA